MDKKHDNNQGINAWWRVAPVDKVLKIQNLISC